MRRRFVCFPGSCIVCAATLPNRLSRVWSPEIKKEKIRQPLVRLTPCCRHAVNVPLPLCPWNFKGVIVYSRYLLRYVAMAGVGVVLLRLSDHARWSCCRLLRARFALSGFLTARLESC